mmetsp:Transcript_14245/g.40971  ORF Transcript_14245/g.40971 Transcript_14245/m.40971 type:complete len:243 (+) Transcript_14245:478-1206(+)
MLPWKLQRRRICRICRVKRHNFDRQRSPKSKANRTMRVVMGQDCPDQRKGRLQAVLRTQTTSQRKQLQSTATAVRKKNFLFTRSGPRKNPISILKFLLSCTPRRSISQVSVRIFTSSTKRIGQCRPGRRFLSDNCSSRQSAICGKESSKNSTHCNRNSPIPLLVVTATSSFPLPRAQVKLQSSKWPWPDSSRKISQTRNITPTSCPSSARWFISRRARLCARNGFKIGPNDLGHWTWASKWP